MKFRFEPILRLNKNKEDNLQRELGEMNRHFQTQQDRQNFMQEVETRSKDEYNDRLNREMDVNTMILYTDFLKGIRQQEGRQQKIIGEIQAKVDAKRNALVQARRKRRTLEILKDRDYKAYLKTLEKREIAVTDETAANQWRRNNP